MEKTYKKVNPVNRATFFNKIVMVNVNQDEKFSLPP